MSKISDKRLAAMRKALAKKIALSLFTAFEGMENPVHCDHIWLYKDGREVAGWAEGCMADQIEKLLEENNH